MARLKANAAKMMKYHANRRRNSQWNRPRRKALRRRKERESRSWTKMKLQALMSTITKMTADICAIPNQKINQ